MRNKKSILSLGIIVLVLFLGVGYAVVSSVYLNISGTASVANSELNVEITNAVATTNVASKTVDFSHQLSNKNLTSNFTLNEMELGEKVDITYTVTNNENDVDAELASSGVAISNTNPDHFRVSYVITDSITDLANSIERYRKQDTWNETTMLTEDSFNEVFDSPAEEVSEETLDELALDELETMSEPVQETSPEKETLEAEVSDLEETIAENAFSSCEDLANVDMKSGVKFIGDGAFGGCNMLSDISIPKTVSSIGKLAFTCGNLNSITIEEGNPVYDSRDNCNAIIETATNTLIVGCKNTIIPNSVTSIGEGAFSETGLTNITIPENVETIADGAFAHCEDLVSVEIKSGVKSIGYCAFVECEMLSEITIPNSVETIADEAFAECDLVEAINIGTGVKSIGEAAFACCENLKTVRCYAEVPPVIGEECFEEAYTASLLVLSDALTNYQNHEEWGKFENIKALTSEKVETDGVQVSPSIDEVTIVWPIESNADKYTIVIKKGTEVICTLDFDSEGMLLNIAFATSFNRSQSPVTRASSTGNGLSFTITGLENDEHYTYTITAKDSSSQTIQTYSGEFTTQRYTGIKETDITGLRLERGRVTCDEEFRIFDMNGHDITSQNGSLHGVYIIQTNSSSRKIKL